MATIKQQVADLKQQGLTAKEIFSKLTEQKVKVSINSIRWYLSKSNSPSGANEGGQKSYLKNCM